MSTDMNDQATADISQQAAAWFVANRNAHEAHARAQEFLAWLRASPKHVQEYLDVSQLARVLGDDVQAPPVDQLVREANAATDNLVPLQAFRPVGASAPSAWQVGQRALPALAASLVVVIIGLAVWFGSVGWSTHPSVAQYMTQHGEQRSFKLPDGSVIHLNSRSEVTLRFDAAERRVELLAGQALFDVETDPERPFRVIAGSTVVVAVGTQFEVYRRGGATLVTVVEGEVAVSSNPPVGASEPLEMVSVMAGHRLRVPQSVGRELPENVAAPEVVNVRETIAWSRRQIVFEAQPLGDVVQEFNRYSARTIAIDDPELAERRISGVFDVHDSENFIAFIRRMDHVVVAVHGDIVQVTRDGNKAGTR